MGSDQSSKTDLYPPTKWSQVFAAGASYGAARQRALQGLYLTYSQPIYFSVRRRGFAHHDAEDLVQSYFHSLLKRAFLGKADPAKGKFRAFIQADLKLFLNNEWRRDNCPTRKPRGGVFSLDEMESDHYYQAADTADLTPEALLDREWARATMEASLSLAKRSYRTPEQKAVFESLAPLLDKPPSPGMYAGISGQLNMSEDTLRVAMTRLRERFAKALSQLVAETLENPSPEAVHEEIRFLFTLLGRVQEGPWAQ